MSTESQQEAIDLLQELGLKEYEAKSFVVLARMEKATAKEIAEHSEVPRTRVYDAIRVLESRGLVEVQHTSPQQFRAVSIEEAVDTLDRQYDTKMERLRRALEGLDVVEPGEERDSHEVWSLTGSDAIETRTEGLLDDAGEEVVFVLGSETLLTDELVEHLQERIDAGVDVLVGALTPQLRERVDERLPDAEVFVSGLEWLRGEAGEAGGDKAEELAIGRLVLVDRRAILVSTFLRTDGQVTENAIFGRGFTNGLVVMARRIMATGLARGEDPSMAAVFGGDAGDASGEATGGSDEP